MTYYGGSDMRALTSMLLFLLLTGCASTGRLNDLSVGMTKPEVIAIMGRPDHVSAAAGRESLVYNLTDYSTGGLGEYTVILVNGRVVGYGRTGTYEQAPSYNVNVYQH